MSVDYDGCSVCSEGIYEEYITSCECCGKNICIDCIVNAEEDQYDGGYIHPFNNDDGYLKKEYCPYCSGEIITDEMLLGYLLNKYDLDKEEVLKEYKEGQ